MIDKERAKGCSFCGGDGLANGYMPRPCPKCQRHCYGDPAPAPDPELIGWYAGRVYCRVCEVISLHVWPDTANERRLECPGCRHQDSVVITRILTKDATRRLMRALKG